MSDDLSGGTSDRRKIAWGQNFLRVKLESTEWLCHLSCNLCPCRVFIALTTEKQQRFVEMLMLQLYLHAQRFVGKNRYNFFFFFCKLKISV